jgi:hypothetical protein
MSRYRCESIIGLSHEKTADAERALKEIAALDATLETHRDAIAALTMKA